MRKIDYSDLRWNGNEYEIYAGYPLGHVSLNAEIDNLEQYREITSGISLDRLREICDAERDGRCVVLPCKVGDTVWVIASCEDVAKSCDDDYFNGIGEITCPYGNTCEFDECADDNIRVFETRINCVVIEEDGKFTFWVDTLLISFGVSNIGKTVFLTRAEAEAARKEQEK